MIQGAYRMGHTMGSYLAFQVSAVSSLVVNKLQVQVLQCGPLQRDKLNAKNSTSIAVVVFCNISMLFHFNPMQKCTIVLFKEITAGQYQKKGKSSRLDKCHSNLNLSICNYTYNCITNPTYPLMCQ